MKNNKISRKQIKTIMFLSIILLTGIYTVFPFDFYKDFDSNDVREEDGNLNPFNNPIENIEKPKSSVLGNETWWNRDWKNRRIISVENPYTVNFTNFGVNFTFNYVELGSQIQSDLDDIRIVENGIPRNYYVLKNYPETGSATVWFDTNITKYKIERDVYMYHGNPSVGPNLADGTDETMGWVKNGDFELDGTDTALKYVPFGWRFTDDPVNNVGDLKTPSLGMVPLDSATPSEAHNASVASYNAFVFKLTGTPQVGSQEGLANGKYAYKWGPNTNNVEGGTTSSQEYAGTLYSYPFKVPKVEGGGIKLNFWRNVRDYIFERNAKGGAGIDYDGYFIRLCNGSAAKYTSEVDNHVNAYNSLFNNYLEAYGGKSEFKGNVWKWVNEVRRHFADSQNEKNTGPAAQLTGNVQMDISQYEGKEIFLEFGSWGQENGDDPGDLKRSGFFQLDYVRFNYTLKASMEELQCKESEVSFIAVDVDGRIVPNVEISIMNNSIIQNTSVAIDGTTTISRVPRGSYSITANYTLGGKEKVVFNSSALGLAEYYINGINYTIQIQLDLWTIDFEIVDWNGIPLSIGYIELRDKIGVWLQNLTLDENGKATFRWWNDTCYHYKIYYDNDDYSWRPIPLNESYVYRSVYTTDNVKYTHHTINLYETHVGSYSINKRIYTNYSNNLENKKIIKANITLSDMDNYLSDISVYYIDKDNLTTGNLIYYKVYNPSDLVTDDSIQIDISLIDKANLKSDNYEAYGLLLLVNGFNASTSHGKINIDLTETCNEYNKTAIARINIKTTYYNSLAKTFDSVGAYIRVNTTGFASLVNLSSNTVAIPPLENGYAYGQINEVPFWFLIGHTYNFTINIANLTLVDFNISYTSDPTQWIPGSGEKIKEYNFTLWEISSLTFNIIPEAGFNFTYFKTMFNGSYSTGSVFWGEDISLWVEYLYTDNNWQTSKVMTEPPGTCSVIIRLSGSTTILFSKEMQFSGSNGNYTLIIDSGVLSAGTSFKNYVFEIRGFHPTYDDPTPVVKYVEVKSIPTIMNSYDYETHIKLTDNRYDENFDEIVKITVAYNITSSGQALLGANVLYSWSFGSGILIPDPIYNGFYTLFLNTSLGVTTGLKIINIMAIFENYTNIGITTAPLVISLYVESRPTYLNNNSGFYYFSESIWIKDAHYYTFEYRDVLRDRRVSDLEIHSYSWQQTDASGVPIGNSGTGDLVENSDHLYTLDFDTELRSVGYYLFYLTLQKDNYELRTAVFHLVINIRILDAEFDATNLEDDLISVVKGEEVDFEVTVIDNSRGGIPLSGATVTIEIGDKEYDMKEEEPGVYRYTFETDDVEAYFSSKTYTVTITIDKLDFEGQEIEATLVVQMEEIFPGIPAFYFWLVLAAISGVFGSLIGYKVVQQARIPIFVKKVRRVSKSIKASKPVPLISIPTKEEMFVQDFEKDWSEIGLDLKDVLGVKEPKSGVLSKAKTGVISKAKDLISKRGDTE